jgi:hypothetical protein
MRALPLKNIIGVRTVFQVFYANSGLFKYLSMSTLFDGFIKFQMTAREGPGTVTMGIFAFTQQNLAVVNYDYGNTDEGSINHTQALSSLPAGYPTNGYFVYIHKIKNNNEWILIFIKKLLDRIYRIIKFFLIPGFLKKPGMTNPLRGRSLFLYLCCKSTSQQSSLHAQNEGRLLSTVGG